MYIKGLEMLICWQNFPQEISCRGGGGGRTKQDQRNVCVPFHLNPKYGLFGVWVFLFILFWGPKGAFQDSQLSLIRATQHTWNYFMWSLPSLVCIWEVVKTNCNWSAKCTQNILFFFLPHAKIAKTNNNLVSFAKCISLSWSYDS